MVKQNNKQGSWRYSDDVRTMALMAFACALPWSLRSSSGMMTGLHRLRQVRRWVEANTAAFELSS
jgi:hypothetical protein